MVFKPKGAPIRPTGRGQTPAAEKGPIEAVFASIHRRGAATMEKTRGTENFRPVGVFFAPGKVCLAMTSANDQLAGQPLSPAERQRCEGLIQGARGGAAEALGELIESWRSYLLYVAQNELPAELRHKVGVSDLVQSACLDIHQRFADFRGESAEEWRAWLKQLVRHDVQDAQRRYVQAAQRSIRRERDLAGSAGFGFDVSDGQLSPRASLIAGEEAQALRDALQRLPDEYRTVLRLRNWDRLPFAEVGRQMDRSEEAARKLWSRAVVRLQAELEGKPDAGSESGERAIP
jgi:RNA polymerase sigma-70 factor (ECF subfamily)